MSVAGALAAVAAVMLVVDWRLDVRRKRVLQRWEDDLADREEAVQEQAIRNARAAVLNAVGAMILARRAGGS